jgi:hypothetical protein
MARRNLEAAREGHDLGLIVQEDLKWSRQCLKAGSTANWALGIIKRSFWFLVRQ